MITIEETNDNTENDHVSKVYDKIADEFHITRTYTWKWVDEFVSSIPENSLIYDIGCGNGRNMQAKHVEFIGIDQCMQFVELCNKQGLNAICANMCSIPLTSKSADHIICIAAFHHLSNNTNRLQSLYEMKRLLKPMGKILLSVWSIDQPKKTRVAFDNYGHHLVPWKNRDLRYYYLFKIEEINDLFQTVGLRVENHMYDCGNEIFILSCE